MTTQIIDDQDHSHVTYAGPNWIRGGTLGEYMHTVSSSTTANESFTVTFKGTSISVYGTLDTTSAGVVTSYALDGAPAAEATARGGLSDQDNVSGQLFWASPTFAMAGDHQLIVKMVQLNPNPQPNEGTIWFDYFKVTGAPSPQNKNNIGAIVGGAVGGISILILLVLLLLFYRRRRLSKDIPVNPFSTHSDYVPPNTKHHIMISIDQSPIMPNIEGRLSGFMVMPTSPLSMEEAAGSSSSSVMPPLPAERLQYSDDSQRVVDPVSIVPSSGVSLPPEYSSV